MIPECDFCIINYPCQRSVTTKDLHLKPRLTTCENITEKITKVHPLNLSLIQEFFDSSMTEHIYADTTFQHPLNISTPAFKLYKHEINNILVDDNSAHLNLRRIATQAKNDEMIFRYLSEPLLEGNIEINENWPDFNALLIFASITLTVISFFVIAWLFIRVRWLSWL